MANSDIAGTLVQFLAQNPSLITQFLDHPYSVTQEATGSAVQLGQADQAEVVTAAAALSTGNAVDFTNLSSVASSLLSQNGGSVHALTNALFGTSTQATQAAQAQPAQASGVASSGLDLSTLVSLAGALTGAGSTAQAQQVKPVSSGPASLIDLSDGFDVKDVIGLASLFMSTK